VISNVRKSIGSRRGDGSVSGVDGTNQLGSGKCGQIDALDCVKLKHYNRSLETRDSL
jgi:hypothetical protein